jgi:hypothetical protein
MLSRSQPEHVASERFQQPLVENDLYAVQVVGQRGDVFADFLAIGAFGGFLDEFQNRNRRPTLSSRAR